MIRVLLQRETAFEGTIQELVVVANYVLCTKE
jgi:hypothetical protein